MAEFISAGAKRTWPGGRQRSIGTLRSSNCGFSPLLVVNRAQRGSKKTDDDSGQRKPRARPRAREAPLHHSTSRATRAAPSCLAGGRPLGCRPLRRGNRTQRPPTMVGLCNETSVKHLGVPRRTTASSLAGATTSTSTHSSLCSNRTSPIADDACASPHVLSLCAGLPPQLRLRSLVDVAPCPSAGLAKSGFSAFAIRRGEVLEEVVGLHVRDRGLFLRRRGPRFHDSKHDSKHDGTLGD